MDSDEKAKVVCKFQWQNVGTLSVSLVHKCWRGLGQEMSLDTSVPTVRSPSQLLLAQKAAIIHLHLHFHLYSLLGQVRTALTCFALPRISRFLQSWSQLLLSYSQNGAEKGDWVRKQQAKQSSGDTLLLKSKTMILQTLLSWAPQHQAHLSPCFFFFFILAIPWQLHLPVLQKSSVSPGTSQRT